MPAAAGAGGFALSQEQVNEQLELAFQALDSRPRDTVEAHAGNEVAMRPPSLRHQKLTRNEYVLRQWIVRDQMRMQQDSFSHEQLTAQEVKPRWHMYELAVGELRFPCRISSESKDGRVYRAAALVDGELKHLDLKRSDLSEVSAWTEKQIDQVLKHPKAGLFTDPLAVFALESVLQSIPLESKPQPVEAGAKDQSSEVIILDDHFEDKPSAKRAEPAEVSVETLRKPDAVMPTEEDEQKS